MVENAISVYMRNPVKHLIILFCSHIILLIWYVKLAWHLCLILQWHPLNLLKTKREKKNHSARKKTPLFVRRGLFFPLWSFFHVLDKDMALCWYNTEFSYYFFLKVSCTFDHNLILFVTCMPIRWQSKEKKLRMYIPTPTKHISSGTSTLTAPLEYKCFLICCF